MKSLSRVQLSVTPWKLTRLLCPWDSPGKSTGMGCHFLLQGIFPAQGSSPGLPHCRQMLYRLSHQGNTCTHPQYSCLGSPHAQRHLVGCSPRDCKELDTTELLSRAQTHMYTHTQMGTLCYVELRLWNNFYSLAKNPHCCSNSCPPPVSGNFVSDFPQSTVMYLKNAPRWKVRSRMVEFMKRQLFLYIFFSSFICVFCLPTLAVWFWEEITVFCFSSGVLLVSTTMLST